MAEVIGSPLVQANPAATTLTDIFTATMPTVLSSILVCNRVSGTRSYRLALAVGGAADGPKQYFANDVPLPGNKTDAWQVGITLGTGDVLRAYVSAADISINVFGLLRSC